MRVRVLVPTPKIPVKIEPQPRLVAGEFRHAIRIALEPRRASRRPFGLGQAAKACASAWA
jgi:hypothetical protein